MGTITKVEMHSASKVEDADLIKYVIVHTSNGYQFTLKVDACPTNNCQIFSLSVFNHMFAAHYQLPASEIMSGIHMIKKATGWTIPLCLVDVYATYLPKLKELPHRFIQPYKSSNGSEMVMALLDTRI